MSRFDISTFLGAIRTTESANDMRQDILAGARALVTATAEEFATGIVELADQVAAYEGLDADPTSWGDRPGAGPFLHAVARQPYVDFRDELRAEINRLTNELTADPYAAIELRARRDRLSLLAAVYPFGA